MSEYGPLAAADRAALLHQRIPLAILAENPPVDTESAGIEEPFNVTWGLDGVRLHNWQAVGYLYRAGLTDAAVNAEMVATTYAESTWSKSAWHHNVRRNEDGTIYAPEGDESKMLVKSTDLGWIQRNVPHAGGAVILRAEGRAYATSLFELYPENGKFIDSAKEAVQLYSDRGFQPWVAHETGAYKRYLSAAVDGLAHFLRQRYGLALTAKEDE